MSALRMKGRVRLQVHEADSGLLVCQRNVSNVMCTAGLSYLAQAALWSAVVGVNASLGGAFSPTTLDPVYGAVGSSTTGTFTLGSLVTNGTGHTAVTSSSGAVTLPAGSYLTLGYGTATAQTVEVPAAVASATIPTAAFTASATFAAGSIVGYVTPADTALGTELARAAVIGGGTSSSPAAWTLTFFYGVTPTAWTVTELGVFVNASAATATGQLLDHAIVPATVKATNQTLSAQVQFTLSGL